ncbi:probable NAD(P)H dehydrogenase (quinone) FQR1-like 2 isoform X2 [Diospyros lotus]|uniref:probable NAD(P)H dehydrogenase (quinone) FQR1-like 2 isoform X2 n=1 Tax=Diospyros lotus TaxID=55363 RepID=UPI002257F89A|nr:probable NAD(P)H dehydrogenase (quinone) FQR1-like 2 isoform X2 [Diospyros lotus]
MGKGGGCVPSKKKSVLGVTSDREAPNPASDDAADRVSGTDPAATNQDGAPPAADKENLRIFIVFYSMYGHVEGLARRMKKGVDGIDGVEGVLFRVPETLPPEVLEQMKVPAKGDDIPVISVEDLPEADGFLFGFPTRFGCMAAQMKAFFDSTGGLWRDQKLAGVPAGFFVSTGTQGGGQETTALVVVWKGVTTFCFSLLHPWSWNPLEESNEQYAMRGTFAALDSNGAELKFVISFHSFQVP